MTLVERKGNNSCKQERKNDELREVWSSLDKQTKQNKTKNHAATVYALGSDGEGTLSGCDIGIGKVDEL